MTATTRKTPARSVEQADLTTIVPDEARVTVAGIPCRVRRLRTREFLSLLRVITVGMGAGLGQVDLSSDDPDELQGKLMGLVLAAAPSAPDEFAEFLFTILEPVHSKDQAALVQAMVNPDLEVTLDVLTTVIVQEKDDLTVLAGKARAALARVQAAFRVAG